MKSILRQISDEADHIIGSEAKDHKEIAVKDAEIIKTLAKKALKKSDKKPRIFIYVSGGLIQNIVADQKVEVMVLDADVDGMEGGKTFKDAINGSTFEAREAWDHTDVEVSKKIVDHYFRQRS